MKKEIAIRTDRRSAFINITAQVQQAVSACGLQEGSVLVFVPHTTAGITINENADPDVQTDLIRILDELVPWQNGYRHAEGNSAAHAKASMMGASVQIPVENGRLCLGIWQGIYFCEFDGPRTRRCWIHIK